MASRSLVEACALYVEREREDGPAPAGFEAPPVDERCAFYERVELGRRSGFEGTCVDDFQREYAARLHVNARQSVRFIVERTHAVDPRIHVSAVEVGKLEYAMKLVVKRIPANDVCAFDTCDGDDQTRPQSKRGALRVKAGFSPSRARHASYEIG